MKVLKTTLILAILTFCLMDCTAQQEKPVERYWKIDYYCVDDESFLLFKGEIIAMTRFVYPSLHRLRKDIAKKHDFSDPYSENLNINIRELNENEYKKLCE